MDKDRIEALEPSIAEINVNKLHRNKTQKKGQQEDYPQYAIMLNLAGKPCTVIGGGLVAARKVRQLLESGAEVTVVCPTLTEDLQHAARNKQILYEECNYDRARIIGAQLVFAATDDHAVNEQVAVDCHELGIMVNIAHAPAVSDFTNPGVLRYGPIQINVSTGGASPTLTRHIVDKVDHLIDDRLTLLTDQLQCARIEAKKAIANEKVRQKLLRSYGDDCWRAWEQQQSVPIWLEWLSGQSVE